MVGKAVDEHGGERGWSGWRVVKAGVRGGNQLGRSG
jgi:hypothetical protein